MHKPVWLFSEGSVKDKELLGNKGANLCEMTSLGMPVPFGFIITTETCLEYNRLNGMMPENVFDEVLAALVKLEIRQGAEFGNPRNPLLVSVRSGAAVSMPGMMDTVLNLGINNVVAAGLEKLTENPRFAYDTFRRFLQMYGDVVSGKGSKPYETVLNRYKEERGFENDLDLTGGDWQEIVTLFKTIDQPPEDAKTQLLRAIGAVFSSWRNPRAVRYRQIHDIPDNLGTAVIVQSMVYGNMGPTSGTGVAFTRNPATGEKKFYGEFLMNAEGEDVVSGFRTPRNLDEYKQENPTIYHQLFQLQKTLERHYREMQDLEFTIQENRLYLLQTRSGKRTAKAAVKIAADMVREGLISEKDALRRLDPSLMSFFLHPMIDPSVKKKVIAKGLPASPGAATGKVVFTPDEAEAEASRGENVILVRRETTPEDIHGMHAAKGILTVTGGMTSHAAVVARGMGKCCVAGCGSITVDYEQQLFLPADETVIKRGTVITLDGSSGEVILGDVPKMDAQEDQDFQTILGWADKYRRLKVRANAETPEDAANARRLGAEGIGLCRTEHMFFGEDRIDVVRSMILAESADERKSFLDQLAGFQKSDIFKLFQVMDGLPVTIRLLDPPLHEFLPTSESEVELLSGRLGRDQGQVRKRIDELYEINPMLGFRGCRLSIVYPEITAMQMEAILTAAVECEQEGIEVLPEIMVPLVAISRELDVILKEMEAVGKAVFRRLGSSVEYLMGTMIEVPRACVQARTIAPKVKFMSFGTNDLTQMTYGFSRDDIGKFLPDYLEKKLLPFDPFISIDQQGVGNLIRMALEQSRKVHKKLKYGVCGEHGGDPRSIMFFHRVGFDYVSCSPYRVPIARLAAAKASL